MTSRVFFDGVWKKFRLGERHDSLRDLLPAAARRFLGRGATSELEADDFWALKDVSFSVDAGEAFGIIGPNGAGKSTSLKLLTRVLRPTRGRCGIRGRAGALIEVAAGFHPDLTGRENVYLQGAIMGMKRAEIARRFDDIVEFAGLQDFIGTPVKRYSSGMNARLGFSIAAHLSPDALIIDEVLAVGDLAFQERCHRRMLDFKRSGVAIVLVSHNLSAVREVCDRVGVLDKGEMKLIASPAEAIAAYASRSATDSGATASEENAVVFDARGQAITTIRAGQTIEIVARMTPGVVNTPLCSILSLRRVESDELIYLTTSPSLGTPAIVPAPGEVVEARWRLNMNVARGHYRAEVTLMETVRRPLSVRALTPLLIVEEAETERGTVFLGAGCSLSIDSGRLARAAIR